MKTLDFSSRNAITNITKLEFLGILRRYSAIHSRSRMIILAFEKSAFYPCDPLVVFQPFHETTNSTHSLPCTRGTYHSTIANPGYSQEDEKSYPK